MCDVNIHLTPAQAWQAWQAILQYLYTRGYSQEQLAEWTGMDPNHALIRHYQNPIYLQPPTRAAASAELIALVSMCLLPFNIVIVITASYDGI